MSNKVIYKEIESNGIGFYGLLGLIGLFILGGAVAFFTMEHHGHYISGMDNQVVWGMPHIFAIFLIVAASGALNVGSIGTVFGKKIYQPLGRLSGLLATVLLIGGLIILLLDLGRPDHVIEMFKGHLNFKSIFAWNMILYGGFIALVALYLWSMMDRKAKKFYKPMGFSAFTWRLILTTGTGSIFGFLVARQAYDAAIMAPLFIVLSFSTGLAVFIVMTMASYKMTGRPIGNAILNRLKNLLGIFVLAVLLLEATRHLTNLYATEHHGVEAFILNGDNIYTTLFWFGFVLFGSLLPASLVFCRKLKDSRSALFAASLLVIIGGFSLLYVIVIGGQAYPLELFPNSVVTSDYFDGVMYHYSPTVYEILLGLGGVAVMIVLYMVAIKSLRFMPASLADNVVDPHAK